MSELIDKKILPPLEEVALWCRDSGPFAVDAIYFCADDDGADGYSAVTHYPATRMRILIQVRVPCCPVILRPTYY